MNQSDPTEPIKRRVGGRSARVRESVLQAAQQAFTEDGVAGLSFTEIGRRAGVHATSIQRRWGSVENVLFDALLSFSLVTLPSPSEGSLREDLVQFSRLLRDVLAAPLGTAIMRMIAGSTDEEGELAERRTQYVQARYEAALGIFQLAAERGEIKPGVDLNLALEIAFSPLYFRTLITRQPIDDAYINQTIDTLLNGLLA